MEAQNEFLNQAFDPQSFDVLEVLTVIGEQREIVLESGNADHKIEVGDQLALRK